jgi:hypothetical protein
MEGYMEVLTAADIQSEDGFNQQMQLSMIREYPLFYCTIHTVLYLDRHDP